MAVIGATQIEPVNILGSYVQGRELGRANQLARQQEMERAFEVEQQQKIQNALAGGLDIRTPEGQAALMKFGPQGLAMAAQGAQLGQYDFQAKQAERAAAREKLGELIGILRFGEKDDKSYAIAYQTAKARGFDMTGVPTTRDPAYLQSQLQSLIPLKDQLDFELRGRIANVQERQVGVSEREVGIRERDAMGGPKREKPPEGYRWTEAGNLEFIPGGPKDPANIAGTATELPPKVRAKREELYPKATSALRSATRDIDKQIETAKELRDHPGLDSITGGIEGRVGSIRGTSTAAQSLYDNLLAKGTLTSLTQLRAASETGGALGNVSNQDTNLLRNSVGALDQSQPKETLQQRLDDYISDLEFAKENITNAYNETYAYRSGRPRNVRGDPSKRRSTDASGKVATTSIGTSYQILEE
jgi:hypothetical protein